MHPPRSLAGFAVAASAAAVLVAVAPAAPAAAAPSNDPTCNTIVNGTPAGAAGQSATGYVLNVGGASELANIHTPAGQTQAAFPYIVGADTVTADGTPVRRQTANFSLTPDDANATPRAGQVTSVDGAQTFPASTYTEDVLATPALGGVMRLRSGVLLGYSFKAQAGKHSGLQVTYTAFRSTDDGATWTGEGRGHQHGVQLARHPGGRSAAGAGRRSTILVTVYGTFSDGVSDRVQLMASTDGGRTFTRRSIIANGNATNGYNETGIAQLPNGKLIAVMRHHVPQSDGQVRGLGTPVYTTSTNNGTTWAALANLSVSFPYGYDPINDTTGAFTAVQPDLKLMPNGVLVLRGGRPDNWVAISTNGEGTGWVGQLTYRNCPSDGNRVHGSTGYGGIDYVAANRGVVIGDNCELTWACVTAAETDFTVDKRTKVWRRWFDVLTPDVGRIDLATKYRQGHISVSTDLSDSVPGHPRGARRRRVRRQHGVLVERGQGERRRLLHDQPGPAVPADQGGSGAAQRPPG
ncbi:sialidase family protein, partial [Catenuloplanes niger]